MAALSTVIIAQDEARRIASAIESARRFSDEIVVVDGGSRDDTAEIARRRGAVVLSNPWPGYAAQRNFGATKAAHDWIFWIDCDELVSDELASALAAAKAELRCGCAYAVERRNLFMGSWMFGERHVRLYNRTETAFRDVLVHETVATEHLSIRPIPGAIYHHGYDGFVPLIAKFGRYATLEAQRRRRAGEQFRTGFALYRIIGKFLHLYVFKRLFLKGAAGFFCAFATAAYEAQVFAALYEAAPDGTGQPCPQEEDGAPARIGGALPR